ncbi:hypothetical protein PVAP13_6NG105718 [Panicum virgatum]|uniref:Uncharacterized protein n=1 Tax=Panicum virgatum TaxID=38727 RepID=A0A8T0QWK9_PANVG|nr:hypothetical protein PVAP13_6NG105718 [Panicum virgatum]
MDLATGAMGSLLSKLAVLAEKEYRLQKSVKKRVNTLTLELESMQAALSKVGEVPPEHLDPQVKLWAREIKEVSYNMEDVVDMYQVHINRPSPKHINRFKRLMDKMLSLFKMIKKRHQIAVAIDEINAQLREVTDRRDRYTINDVNAYLRDVGSTTHVGTTTHVGSRSVDPRLRAMYTEVTELVGISGTRDQELIEHIKILPKEDHDDSKKELGIVSVVGSGGLGKTTLVKAVYNIHKQHFDCWAFVPVGRKSDLKKVFRDMIIDLNKYEPQLNLLDERQLIDKLQEILKDKKYLIVIDDIWDKNMWENIILAFQDRKNGSRIITTTRIVSVSQACCSSSIAGSVYEMKPLSTGESKRLFYKRLRSDFPHEFEEDILKKCGGIPLVIITIASTLATGQREWPTLAKYFGHGHVKDASVEDMHRVLSSSYYDLPSDLKTCLLYLSIFPEDSEIERD